MVSFLFFIFVCVVLNHASSIKADKNVSIGKYFDVLNGFLTVCKNDKRNQIQGYSIIETFHNKAMCKF